MNNIKISNIFNYFPFRLLFLSLIIFALQPGEIWKTKYSISVVHSWDIWYYLISNSTEATLFYRQLLLFFFWSNFYFFKRHKFSKTLLNSGEKNVAKKKFWSYIFDSVIRNLRHWIKHSLSLKVTRFNENWSLTEAVFSWRPVWMLTKFFSNFL